MSQRHDAPTVNLRGVRADLAPEAASPAEALAARLGEEMAAAWRRGERPLAEEYLARHPELAGDPQAAVCLIYDEVLLRGEFDAEQPPSEVLRRFPQWHTELGLLLDCHRLLQQPQPAGPRYPEPGETLGDLRLLRELGRGAQGRVVLAVQSFLADRPVVLKMSPVSGQEHLTLARLQHTHVAPLYWVQDFANRGLRVLCMPYLGGATLHHLLAELAAVPPAERAGRHLVAALDRAQEAVRQATGVAVPAQGPARARLLRLGYVEAVCWLGACLCDALHHAHERGLVHLDVKPSNVLLAADGEPLLLDFHLAREPLAANDPVPEWFGGTLDYMSPEQRRALAAVKAHQPIPQDVDRRSDVYSLGLVLYEALGGEMGLADQASLPPLYRCNPQVSVGLSDVVHKCLAEAPAARGRT